MTGPMHRREFLRASLGSAGLIGASGLLDRSSAYAEMLRALQPAVGMRRNVYCLTASSREIVSYKAAVAAMTALDANLDTTHDGTAWTAQANLHGATDPVGGMLTDRCVHAPYRFLPWHRMFLYRFERIIRKRSGDANFMLPYWGYSPEAEHNLPAVFRGGTGNPLYHDARFPSVNAGDPLDESDVSSDLALLQVSFQDFVDVLYGTPHAGVHGGCGFDMAAVPTSARDPIFWLHHCQIDRLWELWLAKAPGNVNPTTDSAWLTTSYDFYDENGATVTMTGAQVLDIANQLGYRYAGGGCRIRPPERPRRRPPFLPFPPEAILELLRRIGGRPPLPGPIPIGTLQQPIRLGAHAVTATVPISDDGRRRLAALTADTRGGSGIDLLIDDVHVERDVPVGYRIFIDLPSGTPAPAISSAHYVGNLVLFGFLPTDSARHRDEAQRVPLTLAFLQLQGTKRWVQDSVRVTFIPFGRTRSIDPVKALGDATPVTIGRLTLRIR